MIGELEELDTGTVGTRGGEERFQDTAIGIAAGQIQEQLAQVRPGEGGADPFLLLGDGEERTVFGEAAAVGHFYFGKLIQNPA